MRRDAALAAIAAVTLALLVAYSVQQAIDCAASLLVSAFRLLFGWL